MTGPLVVLAAGSVFAGWLGAPEYLWGSRWNDWLGAFFPAAEHHGSFTSEITVTILTLAAVLVAIYLAFRKYGGGAAEIAQSRENFMYRLALNKYYVDEIYDYLVVRPFTAAARFFAQFFDPWVIDGSVNGVAALARGFSWLSRSLQTGNVQHYIAGFLVGALALLAYYIGEL
jgi:NADH-quinone oxidoreductase subunit L